MTGPALAVQPAPFVKGAKTVRGIMGDVLLALCLPLAAAVWHFGPAALLIVGAATAGAVGTEALLARKGAVRDLSGLLTGVLLGLTLPPGLPLWMAFLGGVAGMGLGKIAWGGLGQNLFNPALVGRAFLQAAFPTALTTWPARAGGWLELPPTLFAWPLLHPEVDAVTAATPLGLQKFEGELTALVDLSAGTIGGSLGETSAALIAVSALFLWWRRAFDWRIPVGILATVAVLAQVLHFVNPVAHPDALFTLLSGGLLLGAVYMATDPVTSPTSPRGAWIYAVGVGALVVLIRRFGGLPEGVMYAILLMNAAAPLIERWTQPLPFGRSRG